MKRLLAAALSHLPPAWLKRIGALQFTHPTLGRLIRWGSGLFRQRDTSIRYGVGTGLRFNTGAANPGYVLGTSEPPVQELLARTLRPGDVFYDIGANVGFFTVIAARLVGPRGHVYAFEPLPENIATLRRNLTMNGFDNATVITRAAHAAAGEAELLLAAEPTWAKLAGLGEPSGPGASMRVELVAVDDLLGSGEVRPPSLVKIDVEGAEIEVLQGMARTIADYHPVILCEQHGRFAEFATLAAGWGYLIDSLDGTDLRSPAGWNGHALARPGS